MAQIKQQDVSSLFHIFYALFDLCVICIEFVFWRGHGDLKVLTFEGADISGGVLLYSRNYGHFFRRRALIHLVGFFFVFWSSQQVFFLFHCQVLLLLSCIAVLASLCSLEA